MGDGQSHSGVNGLNIYLNLVFEKFSKFLLDVNYLACSHLNESQTHKCNVDK